jgi:hypothetical protein
VHAPVANYPLPLSRYRHGSRLLFRLGLLLTLCLAGWLRFFRIDRQSYWNDEGNSLRLTARPVSDIVHAAAGDIHPPGYYLALKGWRALVGETEFALRGFSALAGVLLVALVYRLGRLYFPGAAISRAPPQRGSSQSGASRSDGFFSVAGLSAALLAALNPFLVYYAQEARMYALLAALSAASFLLFSLWLRSSRPPAPASGSGPVAGGYVLVTALGLYTHYAFGFVVLAQNLAALGGLLAHARGRGPARLAAWLALQAAALALFRPWLPVALRQLTSWPAERAALPFWSALPELARYLVFGRTLPAAEAGLGLLGAAALLAFGLRRRGQTITPLIWLALPAALTLGFGLLTEPFAKFLLVAVPAACLLLGQGLAAIPVPAGAGRPLAARAAQGAMLVAWLAAAGILAAGTFRSLDNLYFNPAYFRDDYRAIARYLAEVHRPGDAIITISPNQVEVFGYYHRQGAPVYPLPDSRPLDPAATTGALEAIVAQHARLFVLFWGEHQADPQGFVEGWLSQHAFKAGDAWYGQVRLATYAAAAPASEPQVGLEARFGEHIRLEGFALAPARLAPGDILQVTLFWRADAALRERYKVFVHIYADADQPPVAQMDGEPGSGLANTTSWTPGSRVADNHGVLLPPGLPPGNYQVMVGLYELFTEIRLPVTVGTVSRGDRLLLATLTVN